MKENTNTIEQALLMYKETVSPSRKNLEMILSQIPEQKTQKRPVDLSEVLGKTTTSTEMYTSYIEGEVGSFDNEIHQIHRSKEARAIRSPYIWIAITEIVTLCSILFALYPTLSVDYYNTQIDNEFISIDAQNDSFQVYMDTTDFDEPTL